MKSHLDLAKALAPKAKHDLEIAEIGIEHDAPLDTISFHLQQTVEKLLKALLASKNIDYPKTHDLMLLLDLSLTEVPDLNRYKEDLLGMASYAVDMRYDDAMYPEQDEVQSTWQAVKEITGTLLACLPPEARP